MQGIVNTFLAKSEGKKLSVYVPCEIWSIILDDETQAQKIALFIRENGIPCSIPELNLLIMEF